MGENIKTKYKFCFFNPFYLMCNLCFAFYLVISVFSILCFLQFSLYIHCNFKIYKMENAQLYYTSQNIKSCQKTFVKPDQSITANLKVTLKTKL